MGVMLLDGIVKKGKMYEEGFKEKEKKGFVITDAEMYRDNNIQKETNLVKN
jgi:hypothetical protein